MSGEIVDHASIRAAAAYSMLEVAWRVDTSETDGNRTYAVNKVSKALNDLGVPRHMVDVASTLAAIKVNEEFNDEKTR